MGKIESLVPAYRAALRILSAVLYTGFVVGYAHPALALHGRFAVNSGRGTAHDDAGYASQKVPIEAAAIPLDDGYRYFAILTPIRPRADVTIKLYGAGDNDPRRAGVIDTDTIAAGQTIAPRGE